MDTQYLYMLNKLREEFGKPMIVSSGYRCPAYNARLSSSGRAGPHTTGKAVDIVVSGSDAHRLIGLAIKHGFSGIGVSQKGKMSRRFVHIDNLNTALRPWVWSY